MFRIPTLSEPTVEFLTECTYGDTWREIVSIPPRYRWLKELMRVEGSKIADELQEQGVAIVGQGNRVLINMSKLPELADLLETIEKERAEQ